MAGYGASVPPFVPVTLVQENWEFDGFVQGKTPAPTAGGGTWQIISDRALLTYSSGRARVYGPDADPVSGTDGVLRHSVALTNATITTTPDIDAEFQADIYLWARSTPGPTADITTGYFVRVTYFFVELVKRVSNVETQLGSAAVVAVNLPLSLTASGSTITVKVDGVSVISVTDTSITSAGYFGCGVSVTYGSDSWVFNSIGQVTIQTA